MSDALRWVSEVDEAVDPSTDRAPGGTLSERGRQAAIEASLGLLGVYFATGDQDLRDSPAASKGSAGGLDEIDLIRAGLRLRVAIAASNRLLRILGEVADRPTFRYELGSIDQVGSLSGALDINRWTTRPRGGDQEVTYPVLDVRRGSHTPENLLATYATRWIQRELQISLQSSLATSAAVEFKRVRRLQERFGRLLQLPVFAGGVREAKDIRTTQALRRLLAQVNRRLRRREIFNPRPYRELAEWIESSLEGQPVANPGDIEIALYGEQFDTKLFELWCLGLLGRELASALNLPAPVIDPNWRRGSPAYSFENFAGRLEVFFQRSITSVASERVAKWKRTNGKRLGGVPDFVIRASPLLGEDKIAILDPKLRQRDRLPGEELYKILGYIQSFAIEPAIGGVLTYTTDSQPRSADVFRDDSGGILIAAYLNPAAPEAVNRLALHDVVKSLLELINTTPASGVNADANPLDEQERAERAVQDMRLSLTAWGRSHFSEIKPSMERIEALVGEDRWSHLESEVRVMMATADLVGHQLDPAADFSGPIIGMCASIEHLIHMALVAPAIAGNRDHERQTRTFGSAIEAVSLAAQGQGGAVARLIREELDHLGLDVTAVSDLVPLWRRLNSSFRVPAAHREVLSKTSWQQVYRLVIGAEMLFARTHDAVKLGL